MLIRPWMCGLTGVAYLCCGLLIAGCTQAESEPDSADQSANTSADGEHHDHDAEGHDHEHDHEHVGHNLHGYWCVEHGVPEEICAQCNTKLAAEFQKKGDWCEEHGRPDSQCFIHHPELEDKFIAQYEAKFGEKPPARTVE